MLLVTALLLVPLDGCSFEAHFAAFDFVVKNIGHNLAGFLQSHIPGIQLVYFVQPPGVQFSQLVLLDRSFLNSSFRLRHFVDNFESILRVAKQEEELVREEFVVAALVFGVAEAFFGLEFAFEYLDVVFKLTAVALLALEVWAHLFNPSSD